MKKKSQPHSDVASMENGDVWSIGSGRLTAKGEAELLRFFGSKLKENYDQIIKEPMPDQIEFLLANLDEPDAAEKR